MRNYLVEAIQSLKPNSEFHLSDNDYSTIEWDVLEGAAPTQVAVNAEIDKIKAAEIAAGADNAAAKAALLDRLGITADEAALLLK
jgi:hypothetical protein